MQGCELFLRFSDASSVQKFEKWLRKRVFTALLCTYLACVGDATDALFGCFEDQSYESSIPTTTRIRVVQSLSYSIAQHSRLFPLGRRWRRPGHPTVQMGRVLQSWDGGS